jgi:tRNA nucleotidyltransferase (CCA-adding enzyme)
MARQRKEEIRKAISLYLTHLQDMEIAVSGRDIAALGLPPGPNYSTILRAVKRAVLNGEADTRDKQLELTRRLANSLSGEARDTEALS